MQRIIFALLLLLPGLCAHANISLPAIFGDHMVLQQEAIVPIWGWAKPNEVITLTCSWAPEEEYTLKVLSQSTWSLDIETPAAGGPYEITLKGYNTIEIKDILIGEVWLGSGQSNMEWAAHMGIDKAEEEKAAANYPEIRLFTVLTSTAQTPQQYVQGEWVVCTPENMFGFSALMYFFGRELHQKLKMPIGLIHSSWGGTPIEVWIPEPVIQGDRLLHENAKLLKPVPWGPIESGKAYNAMIHPLIPFRIKGALWYQGESNTINAPHYARALKTLIQSWRALWGDDFSFYYAQIAPYSGYGTDNVNGAMIRDQQRKALDITDGTGMAVLSDIGDLTDIHPKNKQDVGKRLAAWALHHDYGMAKVAFSGPLYRSYEVKKGKVLLHFDHVEGGLVAKGGELTDFEVLNETGIWQAASAQIKGESIEVAAKEGGIPQGIRFAYRNDATPNLFNAAGLPASCFELLFDQ